MFFFGFRMFLGLLGFRVYGFLLGFRVFFRAFRV